MMVGTVIELRVNNRMLTCMSDDFSQQTPINPAHLMYDRPLTSVPTHGDEEIRDPSYMNEV